MIIKNELRARGNGYETIVTIVDLSRFDNSDFDRGAPRWKEALWVAMRCLFFQNPVPWPSALRVSLPRAFGAKIVGILSLAQVTIGSNVCISQRAYLCTGSHDFRREDFKLKVAPITVRDGSWIAAMSFIAPGVEIGSGALVVAGSVVFRDVAPGSFVRGSPAAASEM